MTESLLVIFKTISVYFFIIVAIRIFGKKEISQLSVIDFVFILLISNSVQNAMVGSDSSLQGGLIAASSLFIANYGLKFLTTRYKIFNKIVQGEPILLIYNGIVKQSNLNKAGITNEELNAVIREHGVGKIEQVNLAVLEIDGNISVLSNDYRVKSVKHHRNKHFKLK